MAIDEMARAIAKEETLAHIDRVRLYLLRIAFALNERGFKHDASKLESPELELFAEWGPKLKNLEYGSDEYKNALKEMGKGLKHHYQKNRHHPEWHDNGIDGMDLIDLIEMICDWKAASMRMKDGDFMSSLEYNRKRFNMSPQLVRIIANTAECFDCYSTEVRGFDNREGIE